MHKITDRKIEYLSTRQAARWSGLSQQKIRELIRAKKLPAVSVSLGKRPTFMVRSVDLEALLTPAGAMPAPSRYRKASRIDDGVERRFG